MFLLIAVCRSKEDVGKTKETVGRQPGVGVRVQRQDMRSQSQIRHPLFMREGLQATSLQAQATDSLVTQ